jgi:Rieske Fe-S protein
MSKTNGLEMSQQRRAFLSRALSAAGAAVCGGVLTSLMAACESDVLKSSDIAERLDIAEEPALATVGGAAKRVFGAHNGGRPVIIVRMTEDEFLVLSSVCTHVGCEVNLPGERHAEILCECHGSVFKADTGAVVQGPAGAPLRRFESDFEGDSGTLTITF